MDGLVRLHEVAVNIPAQALNDLTLPEQIFGLLDGEGLPGSSLVLEVTETGAMKDVVSAIYMSALSSQT